MCGGQDTVASLKHFFELQFRGSFKQKLPQGLPKIFYSRYIYYQKLLDMGTSHFRSITGNDVIEFRKLVWKFKLKCLNFNLYIENCQLKVKSTFGLRPKCRGCKRTVLDDLITLGKLNNFPRTTKYTQFFSVLKLSLSYKVRTVISIKFQLRIQL